MLLNYTDQVDLWNILVDRLADLRERDVDINDYRVHDCIRLMAKFEMDDGLLLTVKRIGYDMQMLHGDFVDYNLPTEIADEIWDIV